MKDKLEALKRLKTEQGLTDADISRAAGISQSTISRWWSGERKMGMDTFEKLIEVYPELIDWLY